MQTVTETFDLTTWFLLMTHCMMIICTKLFSNPTMQDKVIGRTRKSFLEAYAQRADCDLDLNLVTWFLFATYCLVMMIICAKLFSNPTMHNKVKGRTQTDFTDVYAQS